VHSRLLETEPGYYLAQHSSNEKDAKRQKKSLKASTEIARRRRKQVKEKESSTRE